MSYFGKWKHTRRPLLHEVTNFANLSSFRIHSFKDIWKQVFEPVEEAHVIALTELIVAN